LAEVINNRYEIEQGGLVGLPCWWSRHWAFRRHNSRTSSDAWRRTDIGVRVEPSSLWRCLGQSRCPSLSAPSLIPSIHSFIHSHA